MARFLSGASASAARQSRKHPARASPRSPPDSGATRTLGRGGVRPAGVVGRCDQRIDAVRRGSQVCGVRPAHRSYLHPIHHRRPVGQGAKGERRTARSLTLARGWIALHDRAIPGSKANLDHVLIGVGGAVYLDTKTWTSAKTRARIDRDGRLWFGRHPQDKALRTVRWEADQAEAALGVPVRAVVGVHGQPHLPAGGVDNVTVLRAGAARVAAIPTPCTRRPPGR
ncbi:nuclease-related domain-containing protein [Embleya sp. NPDC059237]|uniref:nuclease-related domain-containing protein n=1 Tax=Embleya sp. NPDC059237 TaxID=3346784 RepID=UPI0036B52177